MKCIFCDEEIVKSSIEHIVPESLGNLYYLLDAGTVCNKCNNRFSEDEEKVATKTFLGFIRIQNAVKTKKGNPSVVKIRGMKGSGHPSFKKNVITLEDIIQENKKITDPETGEFELYIPDFDKTEVAASRFLLKMGFESLHKSNKNFLSKYDFTYLKNYLTNKENKLWPFITSHKRPFKFVSIPTFNDKYELNRIKVKLGLYEMDENCLLFDFQYDYFNMTINLLNRDYLWSKIYFEIDTSTSLYPKNLNIRKLHPTWAFKRPV